MLRSEYTYLFLDFETTGLDTTKDDPIQIGCLLMNSEGVIENTFSSFLRPRASIQELKSIVTYLTQTSLEKVQQAPTMEEIMHELTPYLGSSTILIGHNINFDLAFLQRYTQREPQLIIDTFPLTKACFHFLPSYSLEVIAQHLNITANNAHDALADCHMNKDVFLRCISHLQHIRKEYMIFDYILQKSTGSRATILQRSPKPYDFSGKTLFFPPLTRPSQAAKKIIQPSFQKITPAETTLGKYFVGHTTISRLLTQYDWTQSSRILSFSHKSKLHIADHALSNNGIPTSLLTETIIFVPEVIDRFLHKSSFDDTEVLFCAKYLSHHMQGHTLVDVNSSGDYKIFGALTEQKPPRHGQIMLTTHDQLYDYQYHVDPQTQIIFFDTDWWWQSLQKQATYTLDPYHILQYIEQAIYKAQLTLAPQDYEAGQILLTQLHLFFGIVGGEIDHLFIGHPTNKLEIEALTTHTRLPKTKAAFEKIITDVFFIDTATPLAQRWRKQTIHWEELFAHTCIIEKCMYNSDKWWYTFSEPHTFLTFDELQDHFPRAQYTYLSTMQNHLPTLGLPHEALSVQHIQHFSRIEQVINFLATHQGNIFILTTSKSHGQDLFTQLIRSKQDASRCIVGENITGGVGKVVYMATQSTKPVIMIGGFGCYLAARAKKFAISCGILYHCEGKQTPLFQADMQFYGA